MDKNKREILENARFKRDENVNVRTKVDIRNISKEILSILEVERKLTIDEIVEIEKKFADLISLLGEFSKTSQNLSEEDHRILYDLLKEISNLKKDFEGLEKPLDEISKEIKRADLPENIKKIYEKLDEDIKKFKSYVQPEERGTFKGIFKAFTRKYSEQREAGEGRVSAFLKGAKVSIKEGVFGLKEHEKILSKEGLKKAALGGSGVFLKSFGMITGDLPLIFGGEYLHKKAFERKPLKESVKSDVKEAVSRITEKIDVIGEKVGIKPSEFVKKEPVKLESKESEVKEIAGELKVGSEEVVQKLDSIEKKLDEQNKILKDTLSFEKEVQQDKELAFKKELKAKEGKEIKKEELEKGILKTPESSGTSLFDEFDFLKKGWNWFKNTRLGQRLTQSRVFQKLVSMKDSLMGKLFQGKEKLFEFGGKFLERGKGLFGNLLSKGTGFLREGRLGSVIGRGLSFVKGGRIAGLLSKGGSLFSKIPGIGSKLLSFGGRAGSLLAGAEGAATTGTLLGSGALASAGSVALGALSKIALPLMIAKGAFDAFKGWKHAAEITGKKEGELKWYHKAGAAASSVLSGLTLGLIGPKSIYKFGEKTVGVLKKAWEYSPMGLMFKGGKKLFGWLFGKKKEEKAEKAELKSKKPEMTKIGEKKEEVKLEKSEVEVKKPEIMKKEKKREKAKLEKGEAEIKKPEEKEESVISKVFKKSLMLTPIGLTIAGLKKITDKTDVGEKLKATFEKTKEYLKEGIKTSPILAGFKVLKEKVFSSDAILKAKDVIKEKMVSLGSKLSFPFRKIGTFVKEHDTLKTVLKTALPLGAFASLAAKIGLKPKTEEIKKTEAELKTTLKTEAEPMKTEEIKQKVMEKFPFSPTAVTIKEKAQLEEAKGKKKEEQQFFPAYYTTDREKYHPEVIVGDTSFLSILGKMIAISV